MQQARYSMVAIVLHWLIAIAVIVNWRIAQAAEHVADSEKLAAYAPHKALGMTILFLTVLRILWRIMKKPPDLASSLKPWEAALSKILHWIFYLLLIGLPLGGWLANSHYGQGVDIFGLFTVPALPVAVNPDIGQAIFEVHATFGTGLILLVALHILGALKHQFLDKDGNIYRMLPWGTPKA
jgi:cytochrome b561